MKDQFTNHPRASGEAMSRLLDRLRASQLPCERKGKHKHLSEGAALAHVRAMRRRYGDGAARDGGEPLPYLCACGYWHTGRARRQPG
jgi:hypothetical protein